MLEAFLERMAATPFVDGRQDCLLTVADWIALKGHPDPAKPYRGRYSTALGRERLLRRLGGLQAVMEAGAVRAGLTATQAPAQGDVGLIELRGQQLAAIRFGQRWAVKSGQGVTVESAATIKAWRC